MKYIMGDFIYKDTLQKALKIVVKSFTKLYGSKILKNKGENPFNPTIIIFLYSIS